MKKEINPATRVKIRGFLEKDTINAPLHPRSACPASWSEAGEERDFMGGGVNKNRDCFLNILKEALAEDGDILFAYLYGSLVFNSIHPESDIDVAVYLKPSEVNPVRNSSGALNPAGIILKSNPAAEQRGIISNGVKEYIKKEKELTSTMITKLHTDRIDLRILNVSPFLLQYNIIKEGIPILIRDEAERVDFETRVMNRFFELKPHLDEYKQMLSLRIKAGI